MLKRISILILKCIYRRCGANPNCSVDFATLYRIVNKSISPSGGAQRPLRKPMRVRGHRVVSAPTTNFLTQAMFKAALVYLKDSKLIAERAADYSLTSKGVDRIDRYLRPRPNYSKGAFIEQKVANILSRQSLVYSKKSFWIGFLSLLVTMVGLLINWAYSSTSK